MSTTRAKLKLFAISTSNPLCVDVLLVLQSLGKLYPVEVNACYRYYLIYKTSSTMYSVMGITSLRDFSNNREYELKVLE